MPSSPGVFPDFIDLMAAKISSNVGGFAMSSWTGYWSTDASASSLAVAGQFSRSLKYSLHLDTIAGFSVSICELSASLIGATAVFCGPLTCLIAVKNPFEEFPSASCCSSSAFLSHQAFWIARSFFLQFRFCLRVAQFSVSCRLGQNASCILRLSSSSDNISA